MSESKNKLINHAQIHWSDQCEPISTLFDDVYFNTEQGIEESDYVFFQGNQLAQRWLSCQSEYFSIAETGFGTGLNFLVCCAHFHQFLLQHPERPLKRLLFTSFEKYPLSKQDLVNALRRWPSLNDYITPLIRQYPLALPGCQRILLEPFNVTLDLWFGDVQQTLPTLYRHHSGLFDCWYLDGFAPSKNPEMWSEALFKQIADSCKKNASIATFTAAGFVRRGLNAAGFNMQKRKGYGKKREMLVGKITTDKPNQPQYGEHFRQSAETDSKDIAIVGGGIASACLSLALIKRGYKVTLYCKDKTLAAGASGNQQGALYPLLNGAHDTLGQFFSNCFLFSRNYIKLINQSNPFAFNFSGVLQLYYDQASGQKLDKILQADLPHELVHKLDSQQTDQIAQLDIGQQSLYYPLGGWLNPEQMVKAIFEKAESEGQLSIKLNKRLESFSEENNGWNLHFADQNISHSLLVLASAMDTLTFAQCEAIPLSAARGQVTHIPSNDKLEKLQTTLCYEGYLTPVHNHAHCIGATFKRHRLDSDFSLQEQNENKQKLTKCITDKEWAKQIDCDHDNANVAIRSTTRDHFPYAGALANYQQTKIQYQKPQKAPEKINAPFYRNLFLLTGLGSRGLCTAPLLAEMLASQINKEPLPFANDIVNALQTNRQWINYLKKGKKLKF
ncbi:MAG: bifunctional tRNA (5-methylaminomethyl-2-thiouridine)(34)-methyltransferase MnmD/FAD-dependent 5-carboxymethylaminomethyl-2-thiouridine(34) oxidoreductase MnmC [Psychromonas sp.]|nr:bifunctional tRNA (5-methylaminomethyl-2-thiouridine)(34)-methyltransferase MnmD/FAD-dependent 5-carboxymethylaminomethyl-2-thiouridine(34) oxidoreductase MnmC [Psychromonas sp.]